jgi:hypothetical protein
MAAIASSEISPYPNYSRSSSSHGLLPRQIPNSASTGPKVRRQTDNVVQHFLAIVSLKQCKGMFQTSVSKEHDSIWVHAYLVAKP